METLEAMPASPKRKTLDRMKNYHEYFTDIAVHAALGEDFEAFFLARNRACSWWQPHWAPRPALSFFKLLRTIDSFTHESAYSELPGFTQIDQGDAVPTPSSVPHWEPELIAEYWYGSLYEFSYVLSVLPCKFSPLVEVFLSAVSDLQIDLRRFGPCDTPFFHPRWGVIQGAELFNKLIFDIREKCATKQFKNIEFARAQRVSRNYRSSAAHALKIIRKSESSHVIRLDLSFHPESLHSKSFASASSALAKLLNNKNSNGLFRGMKGYIRKTEYYLDGGINFHLIFFFDSLADFRRNLAGDIGRYWETTITKGQGMWFDCKRHPNVYKSRGIGPVSKDDDEVINDLLHCIGYLCRIEEILLPICEDGPRIRTFANGGEVKRVTSTKRSSK
jgi:hypothetical protein